ncbi:GNAT family N-acetyltransferase [Pelagibacterium montanilacus]|uniref:GNAT family N-acetyltransferase n=1 Tax=Pelagibacterium montanilacus TaxID=2185280 RepID=UPI001FE94B09|nr:GNAT family N-acetyltransferase [Pelagibacterium montanilacus]
MPIRHIPLLGEDDTAWRYVSGMFRFGQDAGHFDRHRPEPTGDEQAMLAQTSAGVPVGFVTYFYLDEGKVWIDLVFVEREHRRLGLGSAMLEAVLARSSGRKLMLGTYPGNAAMRALAARAGFGVDHLVYQCEVDV